MPDNEILVGLNFFHSILFSSIKINGDEIVGLKEKELSEVRRKNIGIVFPSFYLIPNLTALENVLLSLEANQQYGLEKDAENLLSNGVYVVSEGANMPTVPEGVELFVLTALTFSVAL